MAGNWTADDGGRVVFMILFVYTICVLFMETYTHRRYFKYVFVISPTFIIAWGDFLTKLLAEKTGDSIILVTAFGFAISLLGLIVKLYVTAGTFANEKCK